MKLKLDENLPLRLNAVQRDLGHDVHTVRQENLTGALDLRVWNSAQSEFRMFVTQDMDFSDLRKYMPGTHCGILLVRLHTPSWKRLAKRIIEIFKTEDVSGWPGSFVVVTEAKVRVVKPRKD
jgi:predicted nuclease of predicted toxin-antitoxin system